MEADALASLADDFVMVANSGLNMGTETEAALERESSEPDSASREVQTDIQLALLATAGGHLQRDEVVRSLLAQVALLAQCLRAERRARTSLEADLKASRADCEQLRLQVRELDSLAQLTEAQHRMELESARRGDQFRVTKLQAAEKEAELLVEEVKRLQCLTDELNARCRDNEETVQQIMISAEHEKVRMLGDLQKLQARIGAKVEALEANARVLEQKADQEAHLRGTIESLKRRLKENGRTPGQSDLADQLQRQLSRANQRLEEAEQQLTQASARLLETEKYGLEVQKYLANLEAELITARRQLKDALGTRVAPSSSSTLYSS